jgi:hypothetical protein
LFAFGKERDEDDWFILRLDWYSHRVRLAISRSPEVKLIDGEKREQIERNVTCVLQLLISLDTLAHLRLRLLFWIFSLSSSNVISRSPEVKLTEGGK